jgi:hypothetical protein
LDRQTVVSSRDRPITSVAVAVYQPKQQAGEDSDAAEKTLSRAVGLPSAEQPFSLVAEIYAATPIVSEVERRFPAASHPFRSSGSYLMKTGPPPAHRKIVWL